MNDADADEMVKGLAQAATGNVRGAGMVDITQNAELADQQIAARTGSTGSRAIADLYRSQVDQAQAIAPKQESIEEIEEELEEGTEDEIQAEFKVRTPEQEKTLYEQRFTPKNNRLFEKLLKEWTK